MSQYHEDELRVAEKDHDWSYSMKIKISGSKNSTKTLNISTTQYNKIKIILCGIDDPIDTTECILCGSDDLERKEYFDGRADRLKIDCCHCGHTIYDGFA